MLDYLLGDINPQGHLHFIMLSYLSIHYCNRIKKTMRERMF